MRTSIILVVALAGMCLWSSPAYAGCPDSHSRFFFINGINSTPVSGSQALQQFLSASLASPDLTPCNLTVQAAPNTSAGLIADICESVFQKNLGSYEDCLDAIYDVDPGHPFADGLIELIASTIGGLDPEKLLETQIVDLTNQKTLIKQALDDDPLSMIVILAHSQGSLFANQVLSQLVRERGAGVLERISIVAIATPAAETVGGPDLTQVEEGVSSPHTTLKEDFIWQPQYVPNALPYNTVDYPVEGFCLNGVPVIGSFLYCHSLTDTYLQTPLASARISLKTRKALALSDAMIAKVALSTGFATAQPQTLRLDGSGFGASQGYLLVVGPRGDIRRIPGELLQIYDDSRLQTSVVLEDIGTYAIQIIDGQGLRSHVRFFEVSPPPSVNQPPTARFSMTDGPQLVFSPGPLNAFTDPATGEARITFADRSTDPDGYGDIVYWDWKVNTQTASLCTGTPTCTWAFQPGGPYIVTLSIKDSAGHAAQASGTVIVSSASATIFERPISLSAGSGDVEYIQVSSVAGVVYAVWSDSSGGDYEIFFRRSTDGGVTWEPIINLSHDARNDAFGTLVIRGSTVGVVWTAYVGTDFTHGETRYARSDDLGVTFQPSISLSDSLSIGWRPVAVPTAAGFCVGWNGVAATAGIFIRCSTDAGLSFNAIQKLDGSLAGGPQLAGDGNNIYVAWSNGQLVFSRSTDGGASFSPGRVLGLGNSADCIVARSGIVFVGSSAISVPGPDGVYRPDVYLYRSTDNGATFAAPQNLSNNIGTSGILSVTTDASVMTAAWSDDTPGIAQYDSHVLLRTSADGGNTFGPVQDLSVPSLGYALSHHEIITTQGIVAIWDAGQIVGDGPPDIVVRRSGDGGMSFDPAENVSQDGHSGGSSIATDGSRVFIVWRSVVGTPTVMFSRSK